MKLILASDLSFLLKYGYDLVGIPKDQMRIGYITTAGKPETDHKDFFENVKNTIRQNGYYFEEFDIEGKTKDEIRTFFKDKNIIHVEGGNTFYLLKAVQETGFGEILKELLEEGRVYIGTSAGAFIVCPTIEVANWDNDKNFGITNFEALNYVPFVLEVHYKDEMEEKLKQKIPTLKYPIRILRNGQGILVEDNKYTFLGDEKETTL